MLDAKAYETRLPDDVDSDVVSRLRDPALSEAFAALGSALTAVMSQIASGKDADQPAVEEDSNIPASYLLARLAAEYWLWRPSPKL
jgi:hypothetical protein